MPTDEYGPDVVEVIIPGVPGPQGIPGEMAATEAITRMATAVVTTNANLLAHILEPTNGA